MELSREQAHKFATLSYQKEIYLRRMAKACDAGEISADDLLVEINKVKDGSLDEELTKCAGMIEFLYPEYFI